MSEPTNKGIILAGGAGSRLHPLTLSVSKQLMPVYDKPMIYYPLSTLMSAGIRDILIITTPDDQPAFQKLLGDGSQWGITLSFEVQRTPAGLAQAFIIGENFTNGQSVSLILGDNIFTVMDSIRNYKRLHSSRPRRLYLPTMSRIPSAMVWCISTAMARHWASKEKPAKPKSNYAVTGLYFYDERVVEFAKNLKPSARGELEITDINRLYLDDGSLNVEVLGRGAAWLDTGTHDSLIGAAQFVQIIERRQGLKICCPEEIAYKNGYIDAQQVTVLAENLGKSGYGEYLRVMLEDTTF